MVNMCVFSSYSVILENNIIPKNDIRIQKVGFIGQLFLFGGQTNQYISQFENLDSMEG